MIQPGVITNTVYTGPAKLVDIGHGQRLNLYCLGSGSPAVIFDAGMGDSTISWALVQPEVSKKNDDLFVRSRRIRFQRCCQAHQYATESV
jgi:hypothetical protein